MNRDNPSFTRIPWEDAYATAVWLAAITALDPSFLTVLALCAYRFTQPPERNPR